jgi:hypothetical protein
VRNHVIEQLLELVRATGQHLDLLDCDQAVNRLTGAGARSRDAQFDRVIKALRQDVGAGKPRLCLLIRGIE